MAANQVDRVVEDIDTAMKELRRTLRGIPFRSGGFKNTHDKLARDVANMLVIVEAARPYFEHEK